MSAIFRESTPPIAVLVIWTHWRNFCTKDTRVRRLQIVLGFLPGMKCTSRSFSWGVFSIGSFKKSESPSCFWSIRNVFCIDGYWNGNWYCGYTSRLLLLPLLLLLRIHCLSRIIDRESRVTSLWAMRKRTIRLFVKKQITFPSLAREMRISLSILWQFWRMFRENWSFHWRLALLKGLEGSAESITA